jgi:hypothetical protein
MNAGAGFERLSGGERMKMLAAILISALALTGVTQAQAPERKALGLVVYKLGEKYATDEHAGKTIDSLADYLDKNIAGADFQRRGVRNKPDEALKLLQSETEPVAAAIVSPGFYFKHGATLKLKPLAEAQRGGKDGDKFSLVGLAEMKDYPSGKKIATTMTADADWLNKAVLRAPEGAKLVEWVQYDNLSDAGYEIVDKESGAPDFILVDQATLEIFKKDDDLKALKSGRSSETLPQDLVVEVDGRLGDLRENLKKVLGELSETDEGKKLGESLQSPKFPAPDEKRLEKVTKWYEAK